MARVAGKDVMLDLIETSERLERGFASHSERLDEMAQIAMEMAARTTALETRANQFSIRMNEMTITVNQLTATVNQLTANVNLMGSEVSRFTAETVRLSEDTTRFAAIAIEASAESKETKNDLRRLTKLVGALAERNGSRLDDIEQRVTKLEKKSA